MFSQHYYELKRKLKTLYRKKKEYTLHEHRRECNRLLNASRHVLAEKMDFAALQKRASETKREEKATPVKNKDGSVKEVFKYKRKKRFGHSINSRSPSLFLSELKRKCKSCGGTYNEVKTKTFRASQYDHVADQYIKVPLSQRMKQVGGKTVQRDLYSAFLIKNADLTLKHTDREKCIYGFESFVKEQDELIRQMKASGKSMKQCFGF